VQPFATMITKEILRDPVLQRMKSDHRDPPAALKPRSQHSQSLFECAKLIVHFHAERLKDLRGRMMTAVTADELLNRSRQRQSFAKRCTLSHLYNQARNAACCRLLSQLAKQPRQLFLAVLVYDRGGSQLRAWIHAHVEGTISHEAEPALRIFELPGRHTNIEKRAADRA